MKLGITGASGFIGRALARAAAGRGWMVKALPRLPVPSDVDGLDAIVHLAGEPIEGRWTTQKKAEIERSRVEGTRALVAAIGASASKPAVLVSSSAVGFYGGRGDEPLFETSAPGSDFLAGVCVLWEREALAARDRGVRTVVVRTGVVLGREAGALPAMMKPFSFGIGGPIGSGRQFVPWIHIDDMVALYLFAIENEEVEGAINGVAPDYATSARLAQAIGSAMCRPSLAPAPAFALRLLLGEFAETLLKSQLVLPRATAALGFRWRYGRLEEAVADLIDPRRAQALLRTFESQQLVPGSLERLYPFFADARNLESITPPALRFALKTDVRESVEGTTIAYRLRLHGVPFSWKTLISRWNAPFAFTDVQLHGPYALWEHRHTFVPIEGGVRMKDTVTYVLPLWPLSRLVEGLVRRDVAAIFAYRSRIIAERFGRYHGPTASPLASIEAGSAQLR